MSRPALFASLALFLAACGGSAAPPARHKQAARPAAATPDQKWAKAVDAMWPDFLARHPILAAGELGLHDYDGKLPDVTSAGLAGQLGWLDQTIAALDGFPVDGLGELAQIERASLLAVLRKERFDLGTLALPVKNPMFYLKDLSLDGYITRDYAPLEARARGAIGIATGTGDHLLAAQANLPGAMPRPFIDTALMMVTGHIAFAEKDVALAFAGLTDAKLAGELRAALAAYVDALTNYKKFLEVARGTATQDFAIGAERMVEMLRDAEGLTIDLATLEALGNADLERNLAALNQAAAALKKKPAQAAALVAADRPAAADLLATAREQAIQTRQFVLDKAIASIPSDDPAEVVESPPFARWNSAALSTPGTLEKQPLPAFYWIAPPDPSWSKKDQKEYIPGRNDLLFTTVHELWPGHFLQFLHLKQSPSVVLKATCSYANVEGWAHYTEEMMFDAGLGAGDAKVRVGMLMNALLRDVRFVSAIGLHGKGMTVAQSARLFEQKAFADKKNALQQAVRGTFDPGYLNYTLGKLMIRKLHDDWKAKAGAAYSLKAFHDQVLGYGCAPLPAIRRAMLGDDSPAL